MIDLFSSNELKLQKVRNYKSVYDKPKSLLRALIQQIFLKLLSKLFPKKFLSYKNKIKFIMNRGGYYLRLYLVSTYLKFKYPFYFNLPATQIYALHMTIKFLKILKPQKIDFFLVCGCLLGAVRQESFAGRPSDIDLGIKEEQLPKLLDAIPLLIKNGARFIRARPYNKPERFQISFPCLLVDIGVYRKKKVGEKEMWGNVGETKWIEKTERGSGQKFDSLTFPMDNLIPIKAYGKEFLAPSNPEIYLELKYGKNWRKSDKKQFFWSKKNLN